MAKKVIPIVLILVVGVAVGIYFRRVNFQYAGTIEATEVDISPQVTGVISEMPAHEGEAVTKDQVIVVLAGEDMKLAAAQAERDFVRAARLRSSGSMPQETYDRLKFVRDDANLKVSWCTIRSPLDGTVLDRYHEPGELVNPSMKLLTLGNLARPWAYVYVPQPLLAKLKLEMEVEGVVPEIKTHAFKGRIIHIRNEAEFTPKNVQTREERTRLVYGVKVEFENPDLTLKPGMTIEVKLPK